MNKVSLSSPPTCATADLADQIRSAAVDCHRLHYISPCHRHKHAAYANHMSADVKLFVFLNFYLIRKTPQVPPVGLVSTRAGRQKKNAQHAGHLHNTSAWPSEFSPFRRPPVVIHAATIDWHRIGLLLAATSRNVHNGHLICIRISSLRITWRFDCF